ncbi:unnamed protein product [Boreogadus saida]
MEDASEASFKPTVKDNGQIFSVEELATASAIQSQSYRRELMQSFISQHNLVSSGGNRGQPGQAVCRAAAVTARGRPYGSGGSMAKDETIRFRKFLAKFLALANVSLGWEGKWARRPLLAMPGLVLRSETTLPTANSGLGKRFSLASASPAVSITSGVKTGQMPAVNQTLLLYLNTCSTAGTRNAARVIWEKSRQDSE